jgi:hypothetical protein
MMKWSYAGGLLVAAALVACKPMYGDPAETLPKVKVPVDKNLKKDPEPDLAAKPPLIDKCEVDISRQTKVKRDRPAAVAHLQEGETQRRRAEKAPAEAEKVELTRQSLRSYSEALVADPFDADATLMLAVSYDALRRKGCALRMLERIGLMRANKNFEADARAAAERARTNPHWFADYRDQAMKAVTP